MVHVPSKTSTYSPTEKQEADKEINLQVVSAESNWHHVGVSSSSEVQSYVLPKDRFAGAWKLLHESFTKNTKGWN